MLLLEFNYAIEEKYVSLVFSLSLELAKPLSHYGNESGSLGSPFQIFSEKKEGLCLFGVCAVNPYAAWG